MKHTEIIVIANTDNSNTEESTKAFKLCFLSRTVMHKKYQRHHYTCNMCIRAKYDTSSASSAYSRPKTRDVQVRIRLCEIIATRPHRRRAVSQRDVLRAKETKHEVTDATAISLSLALAVRLCCASHKEKRTPKHFSWRRSRLEQGSMARRRLTFDGRCTARFCSLTLSLSLLSSFSHTLSGSLARSRISSPRALSLVLFFYFFFCRFLARYVFFLRCGEKTCATAVTRVCYK